MADEIAVPIAVAQAALDAHTEVDMAEHAAIANAEDEDYKWLTDRLDALSAEVASLRAESQHKTTELLTAFQETREQSRTLIEAQTRMIETLTSNLTALSESALLRSLPNDSQSSSQNAPPNEEPIAETITATVIEPASQEQMPVPNGESGGKKRRRI